MAAAKSQKYLLSEVDNFEQATMYGVGAVGGNGAATTGGPKSRI